MRHKVFSELISVETLAPEKEIHDILFKKNEVTCNYSQKLLWISKISRFPQDFGCESRAERFKACLKGLCILVLKIRADKIEKSQ